MDRSTKTEFEKALERRLKAQEIVHSLASDFKGHGWWTSHGWSSESTKTVISLLEGKDPEVECLYCGEELNLKIQEESLIVTNDHCSLAHGVPDEYSVDLKFPSGKVVFANDLRAFIGLDEVPFFNVNSEKGMRGCFEFYGQRGLGHGFVGNSCPNIYRNGDDFVIANPGVDEHYEVDEEPDGEKIGDICTDLWWYSIADYDLITENGYEKDSWDTIAEVPPGSVYTLTYYTRWTRDDDMTVYSVLSRKDV